MVYGDETIRSLQVKSKTHHSHASITSIAFPFPAQTIRGKSAVNMKPFPYQRTSLCVHAKNRQMQQDLFQTIACVIIRLK